MPELLRCVGYAPRQPAVGGGGGEGAIRSGGRSLWPLGRGAKKRLGKATLASGTEPGAQPSVPAETLASGTESGAQPSSASEQ